MDTLLFTPASLIDLLSKIDELADLDIGLSETIDGHIQLVVGESTYDIDTNDATEISVDDSVVDEVEDVNEETYQNLDDSIEVDAYDDTQPIESGILKELAKSLLLGGMIRLSKKLLK